MVPCKVGQEPPSASVIKNKFGAGLCLFYCFTQQLEVLAKQKMMSHSEGLDADSQEWKTVSTRTNQQNKA